MGLYLGIDGEFIETARYDSSGFSLLARGDGSEVILNSIKKDKLFYVYPSEDAETMEFFYILEGECIYKRNEENIILKQNDYFYVKDLKEAVFFSALTDMKVLWYTTKPAFYTVSNRVELLAKIVKQVEEKDNYTFRHSVRVQEHSFRIARMIKLSKERLENLYLSTIFHDVGKIHTPEDILNKEGRLTREEFDIVKRHSYDGYLMVKDLYNLEVSLIVLQHHERLDGSGYPYGIKEDEILLEAKIIGIADTFDAMTSDRPYRKGLPAEVAMDELKRLSGIHYDTELVNLFEKALIADGVLKAPEQQ